MLKLNKTRTGKISDKAVYGVVGDFVYPYGKTKSLIDIDKYELHMII